MLQRVEGLLELPDALLQPRAPRDLPHEHANGFRVVPPCVQDESDHLAQLLGGSVVGCGDPLDCERDRSPVLTEDRLNTSSLEEK